MTHSKSSNQKGSTSLIIVLGLAVIGTLAVLQISSSLNQVNDQHSRDKLKQSFSEPIRQIAQKIKQGFALAQMSSTCPATSSLKFKRIVLNGAHFCAPEDEKYCVTTGSNTNSKTALCASASPTSLNWKSIGKKNRVRLITKLTTTSTQSDASNRRNSIVIPRPGTDPVWRSCEAPSVCVRIALCAPGVVDCAVDDAIVSQVVRLGEL